MGVHARPDDAASPVSLGANPDAGPISSPVHFRTNDEKPMRGRVHRTTEPRHQALEFMMTGVRPIGPVNG